MSWSYDGIGKPTALKADVKEKFAQFKPQLEGIPHEHASAALSEEIIDGQLNFLARHSPKSVLRISASGSAHQSSEHYPGASSHTLTVETLGQIIE